MKKIININLSSRLIPIEDSAYEILRQYLDSLKRYFSKEDGAEEIVGDIESRIAEIFQDKIRKGAHCITDEDVQAIKTSMGTPEQFVEEDGSAADSRQKATSEPFAPYIRPRKRLYRDPDGKVLGGVCSGLGAYFNVDPLVFRIIFAIAAVMWGGGILLYFILWFATPEAITAAERLEMRGERVDLSNIKATVQEEMNSFRSRMDKMGDDVRNFSEGRGKQFGRDAGSAIEGFFRGLANVIAYIAKGFFLFLAVVMLFVLVVGLIMSAVFSAVLIPVKDLLLDNGPQTVLFWPALALLVGIPILSLVIFLVRKMAGIKQQNRYAGYTLGFFWLLGVVFSVWVGVSLARDFNTRYRETETISVTQPSQGRLIVKKAEDVLEVEDVNLFDGNLRVVDDTVIIDDINIRVLKSETDSFGVEVVRSARGRTVAQAKEYTRRINVNLVQNDSVLYIPSGISIPRDSKYRNQQITVVIRVPVGKHILIDREVRHHYNFIRNWREEWWDDHYDWDENNQIDIRMTPNGWERKDLKERKKEEERSAIPADTAKPDNKYRYRGPGAQPEQNTTPTEDSSEKEAATERKSVAMAVVNFMFQNTFRAVNQSSSQ